MAKIVIVDDDKTMLSFLEVALLNEGHEAASFESGIDALKYIEKNKIDLLLTDIVMPEMDGIELSQKANAIDPDIKMMFITGFAATTAKQKTVRDTEDTIVAKPFHMKELISNINDILDI